MSQNDTTDGTNRGKAVIFREESDHVYIHDAGNSKAWVKWEGNIIRDMHDCV